MEGIGMEVTLLVLQGRPQRKSLVFPRGSYVFGRGMECQVRPNSEWVSRQHCQLLVTGDAASIRDLGSRNGTLINRERVMGERGLSNGDQLQIGPLVFEVRLEQTPSSSVDLAGVLSTAVGTANSSSNCLESARAHAVGSQESVSDLHSMMDTRKSIDIGPAST
jgi:pSer/pThr/pTyr-binding forkhead associated (FHA) protein